METKSPRSGELKNHRIDLKLLKLNSIEKCTTRVSKEIRFSLYIQETYLNSLVKHASQCNLKGNFMNKNQEVIF